MKIEVFLTLDRIIDAYEDMAERFNYEDELIENSAYLTRKKIIDMYTTLNTMRNTAYKCWKKGE